MRTTPRFLIFVGLLGVVACNGTVSCSGCGSGPLLPIPGGFNPAAQIDKAAQIRVTDRGFNFIETSFQDLMGAYLRMHCGSPGDIDCPTGFTSVPGMPNPSMCDVAQAACVEQASGAPGPIAGFEIEWSEQGGATVCRDDPTDPNRRRCFAWLRFESLQLTPRAPDALDAIITVQIDSTQIPIHYDAVGADCVVRVNSNASGTPLQDLTMTAHLTQWNAPSGSGGRQLKVAIDDVDAMIPDTDVRIEVDPIFGDAFDTALCGLANFGAIKSALIAQITGSLGTIVNEQVDRALGMVCAGPNGFTCPAQTSCDADDGFCKEDATGDIVPTILGTEGRVDFASLLGGLFGSRPGQGDLSFLVGGNSSADSDGLSIALLGGAEVVTPDPTCATILPSPRLRPGWVAPPALPSADTVDLDFDGVPETEYMLAAGLSQDLLRQVLWTVYTTGLFCQSISGAEIEQLNTGALSFLMPSLRQLTHGDKYRFAIFPARLSLFAGAEPEITIGSGKTSTTSEGPSLDDPLIALDLNDLTVSFQALIEDRWVHLMSVRQDVHLALGAVITPANQVQLVLGDISMSISDVQVIDSEILAEDPSELEGALPTLLQLALPQLTGALPPFALPSGAELGGFELDVLGIRGVEGTMGDHPNLAVYANLAFDPSLVPALSFSADTRAAIRRVEMPPAAEQSVAAQGGPKRPVAEIALEGAAPEGAVLEYQVRVDGSLWTPFFRPADGIYRMDRPELAVQGHHHVEARARVVGEYRTLDPSPAVLDVVIDGEPPRLEASLATREGGIVVHAFDVVSRDRVALELGVSGVYRAIAADANGFVSVPEVADPEVRIAVRASDEQGLTNEVVLREGRALAEQQPNLNGDSDEHSGCECITHAERSRAIALVWMPLFALVYVARARGSRRS